MTALPGLEDRGPGERVDLVRDAPGRSFATTFFERHLTDPERPTWVLSDDLGVDDRGWLRTLTIAAVEPGDALFGSAGPALVALLREARSLTGADVETAFGGTRAWPKEPPDLTRGVADQGARLARYFAYQAGLAAVGRRAQAVDPAITWDSRGWFRYPAAYVDPEVWRRLALAARANPKALPLPYHPSPWPVAAHAAFVLVADGSLGWGRRRQLTGPWRRLRKVRGGRKAGHAECEACERPFGRAEGIASAWRYAFAVRETATALVRAGRGDSYRKISRDLREDLGRTQARGPAKGTSTPRTPQLVIDYLDAFGALVADAVAAKEWPRIVALDALPIRVRDHSLCCAPFRARGERPPRHPDTWGPPPDPPKGKRRPKVAHSAPIKEIGRILVAVGYRHPGDANPKPVLMRFAGGGDQVSWTEFLTALPGAPEWVVSDRDGAIANAAGKAVLDGVADLDHPIWALLERAQYGPDEWLELLEGATTYGLGRLVKWISATTTLMTAQWTKRQALYPRSAGACEDTIRTVSGALGGREPHFHNADRLNLLLALVRADIIGAASVAAYSRILREAIVRADGRPNPDWWGLRDPADGASSMAVLLADAIAPAKAATSRRMCPRTATTYRAKRAAYEQERVALGLPASPRGRPRVVRAQGSVAGRHVADYGWLVAEFHPDLNGDLKPADVAAGSGEMIWWRCASGPDHEWAAQVRSRTLRGTGCPFCAHRLVAASEAFPTTHPDIAAQWHPTRNGTRSPSDFTYGSHNEAWWQCPRFKTHVWRARIASRTSMLAGCPHCAQLAGKGGHLKADAPPAAESA
jgi:hypothetical protein